MTSEVMAEVTASGQGRGMNLKRIVAAFLLLDFSVLTAVEIFRHGYTGYLRIAFTDLSAGIILADLAIALLLVVAWMIQDARARKVTVWPYVVLTMVLGSVGPLAYLVLRPRRSALDGGADDAEQRSPGRLGLEADQPPA